MNKKPNENIRCSVKTCSHQCKDSSCCTLDGITVGNTNQSAEHAAATECDSFEFAGELSPSVEELKNRFGGQMGVDTPPSGASGGYPVV
jgi:Domain of Unknown Function (DUF1540).